MADRNDHLRKTAIWADEKHAEQQKLQQDGDAPWSAAAAAPPLSTDSTEKQLMDLYRQSVTQSGVRVVPELQLHHKIANFWQDHPFRILVAASVPAVAYIYYGRSGQEHLQTQMKIMHTRVMGQFTVLAILLSLMGFKGYMDSYGRFISEQDAERSVMELAQVRAGLLERMAKDKQHQADIDSLLLKAHDEDVKTGHVHEKKKKKGKQHHEHAIAAV